jgi:hypothetical protein
MNKDLIVSGAEIVDAEIVGDDEVTDGHAVLPGYGLTDEERDNPGELTVAELTALDWEGDGTLRNNHGDLADAQHDNTARAGFALRGVAAFSERVGGTDSEPVDQQIGDLLGDLMHLADALDLDFDYLVSRGRFHYDPETRGEL